MPAAILIRCLLLLAEPCSKVCDAWGMRCPGSSPDILLSSPLLVPRVECSGHGSCIRSPVDCREGQSCSAACSCEEAYAGKACAITEAELQQLQQVRESFLEAIVSSHCTCSCSNKLVQTS